MILAQCVYKIKLVFLVNFLMFLLELNAIRIVLEAIIKSTFRVLLLLNVFRVKIPYVKNVH